MPYLACSGEIRSDSKGNWWYCDTIFEELTDTEFQALIDQASDGNTSSTVLSDTSIERLAGAIEQFNTVVDGLFTFDAELFGIVLFGCVLFFSKGWGAGVVARLLSKK